MMTETRLEPPEIVLVRYGELALKGGNRGVFERALVRNIRHATRHVAQTEIQRSSSDAENDVILQGPLDNDFDPADGFIDVLGIRFVTNGSTAYEDADDQSIDAAIFAGQVSAGDIVKIKDEDPEGSNTPDGTADEIDVESYGPQSPCTRFLQAVHYTQE